MIFNDIVTANNSPGIGIFVDNSSSMIFEDIVTAVNNKTTDIHINNFSTATFNGDVTSGNLYAVNNSTVTFGNGMDDITVSASIWGDLTSDVLFNGSDGAEGGSTFVKAIGKNLSGFQRPFREVKFKGTSHDKKIKLGDDVFSEDIYIDNVTFTPTENITLTSVINTTTHLINPALDLGSKTLAFSGNVVHEGLTQPVTINTTFDGGTEEGGHIVLLGSSEIDLTDSSALIINLTDTKGTVLPAADDIRTLDLFVSDDDNQLTLKSKADTKINPFTFDGDVNRFIDWTFDPITGILTGVRNDEVEEILVEVVNNPNAGNLTPETTEEIINIAMNQGNDAAAEAVERLTNSDAVALAISPVNLAIQDATQVVSQRAEQVSQPLQFITPVAVASSDARA